MGLSKLKQIIKEVKEEKSILLAKPSVLQESSFSRAKKHVEEFGKEFVMISAYRGGKGQEGNRAKHQDMKSSFKSAGFPFVEMTGGYSEEGAGDVTEPSLLVFSDERPDVERGATRLFDLAAELAKKYKQESFIYGQPMVTADGETALKKNPRTNELSPVMDIGAYDSSGEAINEPWAGPWNSLTVAKDDDVYWSVVGGKKGKLTERLDQYKKFRPISRETAMKKDYFLKSLQSGLERLK